jgi:hypothetical protein
LSAGNVFAAVVFFGCGIAHLILVFQLARVLSVNHPDFWKRISWRPLWDPFFVWFGLRSYARTSGDENLLRLVARDQMAQSGIAASWLANAVFIARLAAT